MAVIYPDKNVEIYEGKISGSIAEKMSGVYGFGYDPVFIPENKRKTFAQMNSDEKNSISHRMKAVKNCRMGIKRKYAV